MEVQIFEIEGGKLMIMDSPAMCMKNFEHRKYTKVTCSDGSFRDVFIYLKKQI